MSNCYLHAKSSVRAWGGQPEDYIRIHQWFDESKEHYSDFRHRALRHHTLGVKWCEEVFGLTIKNSDGKEIPTRLIAEQHIREDLGGIPSIQDWLSLITPEAWQNSAMGVRLAQLEEQHND